MKYSIRQDGDYHHVGRRDDPEPTLAVGASAKSAAAIFLTDALELALCELSGDDVDAIVRTAELRFYGAAS